MRAPLYFRGTLVQNVWLLTLCKDPGEHNRVSRRLAMLVLVAALRTRFDREGPEDGAARFSAAECLEDLPSRPLVAKTS
ncbi:MAG: hypothetical protein Ct9H300mP1_37930 [Planctomycetaceae bacterium]|nr:MAG: hypothetical protein Ct9H300mP1_37930 [Planctomycetaceae bacterium]